MEIIRSIVQYDLKYATQLSVYDLSLISAFVLFSNAIRNDLQHPNEYIRGATLRFLCKLREPELLEPLLPTCRACLEHRHSYVRKNAVFAIYSIYKHFEYLIPDAPELIQNFLAAVSLTHAFICSAHF